MPWTDAFGAFNRLYDFLADKFSQTARQDRRIAELRAAIRTCVYDTQDVDELRRLRVELDSLLDDVRRRGS